MNEKTINNFYLSKEKRLKLLEYQNIDISSVVPLLIPLTIDLMDQCYKHLMEFHDFNKKKNKKYYKIQLKVTEQLKDLLTIKKELIKEYNNSNIQTKADLYKYIYAYQMIEQFYDQYIYRLLIKSLKEHFSKNFWEYHQLDQFIIKMLLNDNYSIFLETKEELSTGRVCFDFDESFQIINDVTKKDEIVKLNYIKMIGNIINDYPCEEFLMLHNPYSTSINNLVNNIKISIDFDKQKKLIKRKNLRYKF